MRLTRTSLIALFLASVIPAQDNAEALIRNAVAMQQAGDYSGAAQAYRAVLRDRPSDVATHVNLGIVLVKLGRFEEAIAEYQAADKLLPGDPRIALNLALAYQKSGRAAEARDRFSQLHSVAPQDSQITMLLADSELQLGNNARVVTLLQPLVSQNQADLGIAYMLGTALLREHRIPEAQVYLDRILRNGDTPEARFLLGTRMFESGDFPAAVKQFAGAADLNPDLPRLQSFYGQALLNTGDPDAASAAFQRALASSPADFDANLGLAQILAARWHFDQALPFAKQAVTLRPQSAPAQLALADCLAAARNFQPALPYAEAAARALPDSPEAHRILSIVYTGLHRDALAGREDTTAQSLARAADPGPALHQSAPDFSLADAATGRPVHLRDFRGKQPVVLVFGSLTCPNFRAAAPSLEQLHQHYGARVAFLLVYIREAHTSATWQSTRNTSELAPASDMAGKTGHATMCTRQLHLAFPAVVDGFDDAVEKAYNAWPSRAFLVSRDGRIVYSTRLTELDFHPQELDAALRAATAKLSS